MKTNSKETNFKLLATLSAIFATLSVTSIAVGYKLIEVGNYFLLSGAAFILPFRYLLGDVLTEVYGYKISLQLVKNLAVCCLLFSLLVTIIINLPSPANWKYEPAFQYVLGGSLKITITALLSMFIGVYMNLLLYSKMKIALKVNSFFIKAFVASSAGELIQYTIVLSILYYSQLSLQKLFVLIFSDFMFQVICISLLMPLAHFVVILIRKIEGIDMKLQFNPFKSDAADHFDKIAD
ncbi:MAG: VUT family protein [Gammaproteobacteria bacterium]